MTCALTTKDILALVRQLVQLPAKLGVPEDSRDYAADAIVLPRDPIRGGWTSTSTSETGVSARRASSSRRRSVSVSTGWSASFAGG